MRWTTPLVATVLMLGACEKPAVTTTSDHNVTIVVPGANGGSVVIGNVTPANLPGFVQVMPGAKVTASTTAPKGGMLAMETAAPMDAVIGFYRKSATDAGLSLQMDSAAAPGTHTIMFAGKTPQESLTATVDGKDGGVTKVVVIYALS